MRSPLADRTALVEFGLEVVMCSDLLISAPIPKSRQNCVCIPFVISLSTYPGTIAFTLTPCCTYSAASALVNPNTPALLAAYATAPCPPYTPSRLETLIIEGVYSGPASARDLLVEFKYLFRSKNLVPSINAVRFVSTMFWIFSAGVVVKSRDCVIPAQFTKTSILEVSSPLPRPAVLKFVVLQKSGDVMEPEM